MGRIPEHVVEEVRQRADAVEVVGRYVSLKKSGSRFWGLCPFHTEKTPSFQVHSEKQIFHCFGCGEGGDVFAFLMRHDNLDFPEAVRTLARQFAVTIPETDGSDGGRIAELYRANERAVEFFRKTLRSPEGKQARAYLERRGVPADLIERFQIGFAPARWDGLLTHLTAGASNAAAQTAIKTGLDAGLLGERQTGDGYYDRFRGRVVFPISEPSGKVTGFGGRALGDDTPKYLNSAESPIYRKGRVLFGLSLAADAIRKRGRAVVVEGYFDLVALHRAGIEEGVAPCGTALTREHARRLRRYTRDVVLLFDGDEAGQRAAERSLPVLASEDVRTLIAFLPEGDDPDTLIGKQGEAALRACVDGAVPLLDHLIDERLMRSAEHAWDAADRARDLAPLLASVANAIERESYIRKVASQLALSPRSVEAELAALRRDAREERPVASAPATRPQAPLRLDPLERTLIGALCAYPELGLEVEIPSLEGPAGRLLDALRGAVKHHGSGAVAHLLSPVTDELPPEFRSLLSETAMNSAASSREEAEHAASDCVARLRIASLDQKRVAIKSRLESCTDSADEIRLLEEMQQNSAERSELRFQIHQL